MNFMVIYSQMRCSLHRQCVALYFKKQKCLTYISDYSTNCDTHLCDAKAKTKKFVMSESL